MSNSSIRRNGELAQVLWRFRREFYWVGFLSLLINLLMLSPTLYMLQVYDRVLASRSELTLLAVSLLILVLMLVMAVADWLRSRLLVASGVRLDDQLSSLVFHASFDAHLSQTSMAAHKAFADLMLVRQFLTGNGIFAFFDAPWALIYLGFLFFLHPDLGWVGLVFMALQSLAGWWSQRQGGSVQEDAQRSQLLASTYLQSKLRNAEVMESMGMLQPVLQRWQRLHDQGLAQQTQLAHQNHRILALTKWLRYTQQAWSLAAGAWLVIHGELSPGAMIAANVLMTRALAPVDLLVGTWRSFAAARAAFVRLDELLATHPVRDPALRRVAPVGDWTLQAVTATAPNRQQPILHQVSLHIAAGTTTVVLGPSGSGKSTLARVLMGIWPHAQGEVLLGGQPLASWNRVELGAYLGYLPQDVELFEGTIAENIARFGEVDSARVIAAARKAGLHELILRFPKGYDTPIGEAGNTLSGGQRQRIGLARALYGDPQLIVLDEPNANLDDAGEAALMSALATLKKEGRTVVLISHRPGVIAAADRLLILQNGRVAIDGPRDAVLQHLQTAAQARAATTAPGDR